LQGKGYWSGLAMNFKDLIACTFQLPIAESVDKAKLAGEIEKAERRRQYEELKAEFEGENHEM
jgi:hypothetical protein